VIEFGIVHSQEEYAEFGVNGHCLHCMARGCGYCFVRNRLPNDNSSEILLPGEPPIRPMPIASISQAPTLPG
jgi:hypothetical protein